MVQRIIPKNLKTAPSLKYYGKGEMNCVTGTTSSIFVAGSQLCCKENTVHEAVTTIMKAKRATEAKMAKWRQEATETTKTQFHAEKRRSSPMEGLPR